jgi:hypothetical protein
LLALSYWQPQRIGFTYDIDSRFLASRYINDKEHGFQLANDEGRGIILCKLDVETRICGKVKPTPQGISWLVSGRGFTRRVAYKNGLQNGPHSNPSLGFLFPLAQTTASSFYHSVSSLLLFSHSSGSSLQQITMETSELKSHTSVTSNGLLNPNRSVQERDNVHLQRMGKKPVLKVCMLIVKSQSRLTQ